MSAQQHPCHTRDNTQHDQQGNGRDCEADPQWCPCDIAPHGGMIHHGHNNVVASGGGIRRPSPRKFQCPTEWSVTCRLTTWCSTDPTAERCVYAMGGPMRTERKTGRTSLHFTRCFRGRTRHGAAAALRSGDGALNRAGCVRGAIEAGCMTCRRGGRQKNPPRQQEDEPRGDGKISPIAGTCHISVDRGRSRGSL